MLAFHEGSCSPLMLKYDTIHSAKTELGSPPEIRDLFVGFQKHLY